MAKRVKKPVYRHAMRWGPDIANWAHLQRIYFWCVTNCGDFTVSTQAQNMQSLVIFEFAQDQDACMFHMVWL